MRFLLFIFFWVITFASFAQNAEDFLTALSDIREHKTPTDLMELNDLSKFHTVVVTLGFEDDMPFINTIKNYTNITHKSFDKNANMLDFIDVFNYEEKEFYIVAINGHLKNGLGIPFQAESTAIVLFGESNALTKMDNPRKKGKIIISKKNTPLHQSLAAQVLFDGIDLKNKDTKNPFSKGSRLAYTSPQVAGMNPNILNKNIGKIISEGIEAEAFPGAQVLVARNNQVVYHETFGYHTYDKKQIVKTNNVYDLASVTKITSGLAGLMKLHGEGKFDLNKPLKKYAPKMRFSNKAKIKIRPILSHHAQIKAWIPYWKSTKHENGNYKKKTLNKTPSRKFPIKITDSLYLHKNYKKQIYKAIKKSALNEKEGYVYSGLFFYLLPDIIKKLTKNELELYLKNTFYKPLGANSLTYNPLGLFPKEQIIPTEKDNFFRMEQIHGTVHDEGAIMMGGVSCNAGLFGTANDLAKLLQMYLNKGIYGNKKYIESSSVQEFTRRHYASEDNRRGLGFDKPLLEYVPGKAHTAKDASPESYGHSGYTGTYVWVDPAENLIFIFLSNRVYPTRENRKLYQLDIRPRIQQAIYDSIID